MNFQPAHIPFGTRNGAFFREQLVILAARIDDNARQSDNNRHFNMETAWPSGLGCWYCNTKASTLPPAGLILLLVSPEFKSSDTLCKLLTGLPPASCDIQ